jgi:hypothetical protein
MIEKLFKDLNQYIDSYASIYTINKKFRIKISESLKLINSHIEILNQEKQVETFDSNNIIECLSYLNLIVSEKEIDEPLKKFCSDYCFLTSNWNQNVLKSTVINQKIQFILRVINNTLTIDDSLSILKHLTTKLEKELKWRPPAFELSSHYFNLLKE